MDWFGNKNKTAPVADDKTVTRQIYDEDLRAKDRKYSDLEFKNGQEVTKLKNTHELELKDKEFEIKHLADERVKKAEDALTASEKKVAVLEKENEMLVKITDLNGDVIDVKKLVTDLIGKLPTVTIGGNLTAAAPAKGGGDNKDKN